MASCNELSALTTLQYILVSPDPWASPAVSVTMAAHDGYTLDDMTVYARGSFEDAFRFIADPGLYNFESHHFWTHDGRLVEAEFVEFASLFGAFFGIPVWAYSDGGNVTYIYGKPGDDLEACAPPMSSGGEKSPITDLNIPFCYAAERTEPHNSARNVRMQREVVRDLARERLALLVNLVFLFTGRINKILNDGGDYVPLQVKDLCIHVLRKKITEEAARPVASRSQDTRRSSISATSASVDADDAGADTADAGGSQIIISGRPQSIGIAIDTRSESHLMMAIRMIT